MWRCWSEAYTFRATDISDSGRQENEIHTEISGARDATLWLKRERWGGRWDPRAKQNVQLEGVWGTPELGACANVRVCGQEERADGKSYEETDAKPKGGV